VLLHNKYNVCNAISNPELAKTSPVATPTVNKNTKPNANRVGTFKSIEPPCKVAIQLNTYSYNHKGCSKVCSGVYSENAVSLLSR
jgi:hypothetical protein